MVEMNRDRINSLQCDFCGSRQKKIIDVFGIKGKRIGYAILCCNCGHVDSFAHTNSGLAALVVGDATKVSETKISCGMKLKDVEFCNNISCPYRPFPEEEPAPRPGTTIKPVEEIKENPEIIQKIYS